jgi:predicted DNA-binding transcriptional regulator AlpA
LRPRYLIEYCSFRPVAAHSDSTLGAEARSMDGTVVTLAEHRTRLDRRAEMLAWEGMRAGQADDLLSTKEVAAWLGCSPEWLEGQRSKGTGPAFVRLSPRNVKYTRRAVVAWLDQRTHLRASEYEKFVAPGHKRGRPPGPNKPKARVPLRRGPSAS